MLAEEPSATGSVYHTQVREDTPRDTSSTQETKVHVALPLVPVRIYSPESKRSHSTYALLDTGSNVTSCHERLLRTLGLQGRAETMSLTTLDKKHNRTPTRVISLDVTDPDGEGRLHLGQVYARDRLPIDQQSYNERSGQMVAFERTAASSRTCRRSDAPDRTGLSGRLSPACHRPRRKGRTVRSQDEPGVDSEQALVIPNEARVMLFVTRYHTFHLSNN